MNSFSFSMLKMSNMFREVNCEILLFLIFLMPFKVSALPTFVEDWRAEYPSSSSIDEVCQLCHVQSEGGDPWNAYGRDIRNEFNKLDVLTRSIEQAFREVELLNSDGDVDGISNIEEINSGEQPGWRDGQVNLAYDRNDNVVAVLFPPTTVDPFREKLPVIDFPVEFNQVATGFTSPLAGVVSPVADMSDKLFIVDQIGVIWALDLTNGEKNKYLDVSNKLLELGAFETGGYDERGLLGFAFHPQFSANGLAYLYLSVVANDSPDFSTLNELEQADHQSLLLELTISNPNESMAIANVVSERELIRLDQPQFNHNGGDLKFDQQGLLYIAFGDGGNADDQGVGHGEEGNGGDPSNPLGSIFRIDPLGRNSSNGQYGIPEDNPFINASDRLDEIFAYGFRNPWRMSFDNDGQLYVADVGQGDVEEINRVERGMHYGWPLRQGGFFFDQNGEFSGVLTGEFPTNLPSETLIDPLFQYDHDEGISVSGGYVYRGRDNRTLRGKYIFADFQKRLFVGDISTGSLDAVNLSPDIFIYSLAEDANSELYIMGNSTASTSGDGGVVLKLSSTLPPTEDEFCVPIRSKNEKISVVCF